MLWKIRSIHFNRTVTLPSNYVHKSEHAVVKQPNSSYSSIHMSLMLNLTMIYQLFLWCLFAGATMLGQPSLNSQFSYQAYYKDGQVTKSIIATCEDMLYS